MSARWISVKAALPDDDITVLVATIGCDEPVWLGWYESESNSWCAVDATPIKVSHWMPLPEEPKR